MAAKIAEKAAIPNPALVPFSILIGEWKTVGSHPLLPNTVLHGRSSFQWIEGGAFVVWHSAIDEAAVPSGIAIFGSDNASGEIFMLYFDERKVSRKYDVSIQDNVIKWWRNAPDFSQRYSWTFEIGRDVFIGQGELSRDGTNWEKDLSLRFARI